MTAPLMFPQLAGQGWSVHKRPTFSTRVANHVSGREVRSPLYAATLYEFEVTFDALISNGQTSGATSALGATSLQTLLGFYLQCKGQYGTFLYSDPTDNSVTNQVIATGDGTTVTFPFQRTMGSFTEPVSYVTAVGAVYINGIAQPNASLAAPNSLVFTNPPAAGAIVSASFDYAFLCRFTDDQQDFENVMSGIWILSSLKFRSVKP